MKKILLAIIVAAVLFVGCAKVSHTDIQENQSDARLVVVENTTSYRIYVDKQTKVMYLRTATGYGEALCVMVDRDGKPLLWEVEE